MRHVKRDSVDQLNKHRQEIRDLIAAATVLNAQ